MATWLANFKLNWTGEVTTIASLLFDILANLVVLGQLVADGCKHEAVVLCSPEETSIIATAVTRHLFIGSLSSTIMGNLAIFLYQTKGNVALEVSIPFGVDAPTVFFMGYSLQSLLRTRLLAGMNAEIALGEVWAVGSTVILIIGAFKLTLTLIFVVWDFPSKINAKIFGGCLAGIGLALLGMTNLASIFSEPLSGLCSLWVFLMVTLPHNANMGWRHKVPHFIWSVAVGIPLFYLLAALRPVIPSGAHLPSFIYGLPSFGYFFSFSGSDELPGLVVEAFSFACLVFCGGYSVVKVALETEQEDRDKNRSAQNDSDHTTPMLSPQQREEQPPDPNLPVVQHRVIRNVLFIDALVTMMSACGGSLVQSTPYIGHSTYRKLGAKKDYSWILAVLLFLLTITGSMSYLGQAFPETVLKPIFVLIALQIFTFAFGFARPPNPAAEWNAYIPALTMAMFPSIAQLLRISSTAPSPAIKVLSSGFVLTSILWGQVVLSIVHSERMKVFQILLVLSVLTFFGFIHSFDGQVYATIWKHGDPNNLPLFTWLGYFVSALLSLIFIPPSQPPPPTEAPSVALDVKTRSLTIDL